MARSYSQDLRDRVIDAVMRQGMSRRAAARRFGVSESSAFKWLQRFSKDGARAPIGTGGHRPCVLKPHRAFLEAALAEQPEITLARLSRLLFEQRGVKVHVSMLCRYFAREGLAPRKRKRVATRGKTRREHRSVAGGAST